LWLAQRSSLHEEDAPRTFVHADRRLLLRFVHRAKASETLGVVVRAEVATTDPDYPAERHVRRTFDLVAAGEGDARASALLRDSQRLGSIAGRIAEARRALEPLSRMPEHGETAALVDEVESVHREHVGPRGQLPAGVARLLSTKLDLVHERIVGMLRRREARGAREQAAAVRALGNAVSAERRRGARPSKPFNKPICDAYRAIKDKGYEPHQIVSILVKREWERAPTRTGGKPERKQLKRRTIDEILVAEGVKEKREK
jgi:hypothetical protein